MRRIVVTGVGMLSPLGGDAGTSWNNLIEGKSGVKRIDTFDTSDLPTHIAGMIPLGSKENGKYNPDEWVHPKEQRRLDKFVVYGIAAGIQALEDAGWKPEEAEEQYRSGVYIGSGIGGLETISDNTRVIDDEDRGPRRLSPFFIPSALINMISGHVSIKYGLKGPNNSVVTACSTGAYAIADAARIIRNNEADVMVAGGAEAAILPLTVAGFGNMKALSTNFCDTPEKASRPWDKDRDGFILGEGAGVVVLEELEHAKKRGAKIYAELKGWGLSGDAYHITAPDGDGAYRAMKTALETSSLNPEDVDYVNAHGTSTPVGDGIEVNAVKKLMGDHAYKIAMSSNKSAMGHLLGAAGGVEAIFSAFSAQRGIAPPTLNLDNPSPECDLDFVAHEAQTRPIKNVLTNSFGFGGTNASLAFSHFKD